MANLGPQEEIDIWHDRWQYARLLTVVAVVLLVTIVAVGSATGILPFGLAMVFDSSTECPSFIQSYLDFTIGDTEYAKDFSGRAFRSTKPGDTLESVRNKLGEPLDESRVDRWGYYGAEARTICFWVDENGHVTFSAVAPPDDETQKEIYEKIRPLRTSADVQRVYGEPSWEDHGSDPIVLWYSRSPSDSNFRMYYVVIDPYTNLVREAVSRFWID